jgi:hypothetical protein
VRHGVARRAGIRGRRRLGDQERGAERHGRGQEDHARSLELDLLVSRREVRDPRLDELQRRSLAYELEANRAICAVLFPDGLRHERYSVDDIAAFITAIDSGPVISRLRSLGWSMDRWEAWAVDLLILFLDPRVVEATS